MLLVLIMLLGLGAPAYAMTEEQSTTLQSFLNEVQRISRAPGMSAVVVSQEGVRFFSSGVASSETGIFADENTLWELASVSKAFTALGLLYLEEQGLLSLSDSVTNHLPWLAFQYNGQPINMQNVRLYHFMHHTVGLTNRRHMNPVLSRAVPDTLQDTVEAMINAELAFYPGERFEYGTLNYTILGLVIESASGQSYESFMEEQIFRPLGLVNTFANRDNAYETGRMSQGYATSFAFFTRANDSPEARGSVPTGYIISSVYDMARWMNIQLGFVYDIPEIFCTIINRSHQADMSVLSSPFGDEYYFYAAGWSVNEAGTIVQHSGDNPGFSTHVHMWLEEGIGITFLSNSNNTNGYAVANSIRGILGGNLDQSYSMGVYQILGIAFTIVTVVGGLLTLLLSILGLQRTRQGKRHCLTGKRITLIVFLIIVTLAMGVLVFLLPGLFGVSWSLLFVFSAYSLLTGMFALVLLCASTIWFVCSKTTTKKSICS
jgi:CubicO group peptidase (beta-lactamase class C family)